MLAAFRRPPLLPFGTGLPSLWRISWAYGGGWMGPYVATDTELDLFMI
jgi:hypothetical protein